MGAAAHQRRHGQGMMRRPEWRLPSGRLRMAGQRRHGRGLQACRRDSGGNRPATAAPACSCPPGAHHQQLWPPAAATSSARAPAGHARRTGKARRRARRRNRVGQGMRARDVPPRPPGCGPARAGRAPGRLCAAGGQDERRVGLIARHAQRDQQRRRDRRQRRSATARPPGPGAPAWTRTPAWRMACRPRRLRMEAPATAPMPAAAPARSAGRSGPIPWAGRPATG